MLIEERDSKNRAKRLGECSADNHRCISHNSSIGSGTIVVDVAVVLVVVVAVVVVVVGQQHFVVVVVLSHP